MAPLLDFPIWARKVLRSKASALKGRFAAIRLTHLANGDVGFILQSHRAWAMTWGLEKREGATRKPPLNTNLIRWAQRELVCNSDARSNGADGVHFELLAARIVGFFYLLRVSEIGA